MDYRSYPILSDRPEVASLPVAIFRQVLSRESIQWLLCQFAVADFEYHRLSRRLGGRCHNQPCGAEQPANKPHLNGLHHHTSNFSTVKQHTYDDLTGFHGRVNNHTDGALQAGDSGPTHPLVCQIDGFRIAIRVGKTLGFRDPHIQ
ncbi:MAG: hypothetical protein WCS43_03775 [Verrucomicrobiota bacterium]